jgi:hypothetical protein
MCKIILFWEYCKPALLTQASNTQTVLVLRLPAFDIINFLKRRGKNLRTILDAAALHHIVQSIY